MHGRFAAIAAAVVALGLPAVAGARTKVVYAGGPASFSSDIQHRYGAGVNNFLINRVTINAGDTVQWDGASLAGGFHTVDIPALGDGDLPLFTPSGGLVSGVNDAAGNPFWFNGQVPNLGLNVSLLGTSGPTTYDGTTRADSGLPLGPSPANYSVTFTKPGTYKYYCDVHPGMVGYVTVKRTGRPVPSDAADAATLRYEEWHFNREAAWVNWEATHHRSRHHHHVKVSLGASGPGGLELYAMFPATLNVDQGTTVTFAMSRESREAHTATFGPGTYLTQLANSIAGPAPSQAALNPSDPPGSIALTPASHGNGFANTGVLDRDSATPNPPSSTITFAAPGTYHFICLIHPFMQGTVVVH